GDLVRLELPVLRLIGLADRSDADLDEILAGLNLIEPETRAFSQEFFHGTGDGIVDLRIVALEPFAEVVVAFVFQAEDHAGPVEPRGLVVALLRVRQVELGPNQPVGDFSLRRLRGSQSAEKHERGAIPAKMHGSHGIKSAGCQFWPT